MNIDTKVLYIIFLILGAYLNGCTANFKTQHEDTQIEQTYFEVNTSPSLLLGNMYLNPYSLSTAQNITSPEQKKLLKLMIQLRQSPEKNFQNIISTLKKMVTSENEVSKQYGYLGLLMVAYETGDMGKMQTYLQEISKITDKPMWLKEEIIIFDIIYHMNIADYSTAKLKIEEINKTEIEAHPFVVTAKSLLDIREDKIDEALTGLKLSAHESESIIDVTAITLYYNSGIKSALSYLKHKQNKYPDNKYISYLYNTYLYALQPEQATENLVQLVNKNPNNLQTQLQVVNFFSNSLNPHNERTYSEILHNLSESQVSKYFIDNSIVFLGVSLNESAEKYYLKTANNFNEMYAPLLWYQFHLSQRFEKLDSLKKLEHLDPYNNVTLIELGHYYDKHNMTKELSEIKLRFNNSSRYKTQEEIKIMSKY